MTPEEMVAIAGDHLWFVTGVKQVESSNITGIQKFVMRFSHQLRSIDLRTKVAQRLRVSVYYLSKRLHYELTISIKYRYLKIHGSLNLLKLARNLLVSIASW